MTTPNKHTITITNEEANSHIDKIVEAAAQAAEEDGKPSTSKAELVAKLIIKGAESLKPKNNPVAAPTYDEYDRYCEEKGYKPRTKAAAIILELRDKCENWRSVVDDVFSGRYGERPRTSVLHRPKAQVS